MRRANVVFIAVLPIFAFACSDGAGPSESPDVRAFVTGAAAAGLDAQGHFRFPSPPTQRPDGLPMLDSTRSADIAAAFPAQFWDAGFGDEVTRGHGSPVRLAELHRCGREFFALSPLLPAPAAWDLVARRMLGEFRLYAFCDARERPVVHIAVSAHATDLTVTDGEIVFAVDGGAELESSGVPEGWDTMLPVSPERAVRSVATCTHARVAEVPSLLLLLFGRGVAARWRLQLEAPVHLLGLTTGADYLTSEVYVGLGIDSSGPSLQFRPLVSVATTSQPATVHFRLRTNPPPPFGPIPPGYQPIFVDTTIARIPDRPVNFERVSCPLL